MSLREKQQMNLDTDSTTHTGMECQSRSSHKYLLLQVWCGLLTVAMVVMAALLPSIKPKSTEDEVSALKSDNVTSTVTTFVAPLKSGGSSVSFIQLIKSADGDSWENLPKCHSCSLVLHNNSIHCKENSFYFIYAQVNFIKPSESSPNNNPIKSVILKRNASNGRSTKTLVEGIFPNTTEGSVWVAKIVNLQNGDSVSLDITDKAKYRNDNTFWGAYQLH
ncbi:uncharacterized protein LOC119896850 [Micropterus salmoides]|uniref:uncharacterized protein LOC119896850 n=1 Tax=Micropterus salmoides TaxID=27706 RepID=UPI0018EB2F04|nr:uncharacterized protein LOC119896850 [Micropterus salmoides]